jgi:hypothetical protein
MPHDVHDTVNAYLAGKIDQRYFRIDGKGVVFLVSASTPDEAKDLLEKFPLGPLSSLRIISDGVEHQP